MILNLTEGIQWDTDKEFYSQSADAQQLALEVICNSVPVETETETTRLEKTRDTLRRYEYSGFYINVEPVYSKGPMSREWGCKTDDLITIEPKENVA